MSPITRHAASFLAFLLAAISGAAGDEPSLSMGGSVSHRSSLSAAAGSEAAWLYGGATGLVTTLRAGSGQARAEASFEAFVLSGQAAAAEWLSLLAGLSGDAFHAPSPSSGPPPPAVPETMVAARIRTLYASVSVGPFKATLGRQLLNFGKGALYSPVDIFAAAEYSSLSLVRRGTDALRIRAALGPLSFAEAIAEPAADPMEGSYAVRLAGYAFGIDASLLGAYRGSSGSWIAGGDAKIDLPFASVYGDATLELPEDGSGLELRAAAGFDASLSDFLFAAEYYHNGGGPDDLFHSGAHNLYAAISLRLSDYASAAASGLWDIENASGKGGIALSWEAFQSVNLRGTLEAARAVEWSFGATLGLEVKF